MIDKLVRFWPIAAVIVAGVTGYIRLEIAVANVQKCPEQIKALADRVIVLETQAAIMKRYRSRQDRSRE